jgi:hypothetical protein
MQTETSPDTIVRIRLLNDRFRRSFAGGAIVVTPGVMELETNTKAQLLSKVRVFNEFNADNDPHGEHDCFVLEHEGQRYIVKIDYYAPDMEHGSEDPSNTEITRRVMTIMCSSEY